MKSRAHRKSINLPSVDGSISYALHSFSIAKKGCYREDRKLRIDDGYGDYNMSLFRLKEKMKYIRTVPTAFTPTVKQLLSYSANNPVQKRIATEHNQQIERIISQPKEVYLQYIRKERELQQLRKEEEERRNEYIKGEDREVRQYNEQLSFNYLPKHQSDQWFQIVDKSHHYIPPPISFNPSPTSFSNTHIKIKKKKGHIFLSDNKSFRSYIK